ncbi:hypothetical protein M404DRAFT_32786 [Pisolithus tinctorius Marx 270]|uniref:Heterokaryon incompatibility domain-containing protein n=1 Tax=Pisolithus tinctorius Marx 270 TaxID=870435 RepID=A0A0C3NNR3_PISTI|nr:hypothetical protein M404DRAFT_32786 [Pisolithus tinctorius Marx 270]
MRDSAIDEWVEEITNFAILSHTWEADELNYEDFHQESGSGNQDDKKLAKFCHIFSSAELDESIRSMFAWYHNAHICIVYTGQTQSLLDLAADHWFTQGWTLQELLAPSRLKFYNKDWYPLTDFRNDKISDEEMETLTGGTSLQSRLLGKAISTATGIDRNHFINFNPGFMNTSLPERMRWIAQRTTSRMEDKSHCTMGIFGAILEVGHARDWFLWEGKALPFHIHPLCMIPSGPECYLSGNLQIDYWDCLDEPLSLTNIGPPITLLVVPARITYEPGISGEDFHPCNIRTSCPLSDDIVTPKGIPFEWHGSSMEVTNKYALGITNLNSEMDNIPRLNHLHAVLLRRTVRHALSPKKRWSYCKWKHTKFLRFDGMTSFAGWI